VAADVTGVEKEKKRLEGKRRVRIARQDFCQRDR
jgi:hypothetical protein